MNAVDGVAESFSEQEKQEAKKIQQKIEEIVNEILTSKESIDRNFVRVSRLIEEVRQKKYWLLGEYKTFGDYLSDCEKKFGIKHSQLYVGMKVARNLLPSIPEKDLVEIGISKAGVLSKYVEQSGQTQIPQDIIDAAKTKKTEELDGMVNARLHNVIPEEKGNWFSIGGFFATEDERQEILDALEIAGNIDPLVPKTIPQWQRTKECCLRMAREFIGTYGSV